MMVSKRNHLFGGLLFRFHVKFQGCKLQRSMFFLQKKREKTTIVFAPPAFGIPFQPFLEKKVSAVPGQTPWWRFLTHNTPREQQGGSTSPRMSVNTMMTWCVLKVWVIPTFSFMFQHLHPGWRRKKYSKVDVAKHVPPKCDHCLLQNMASLRKHKTHLAAIFQRNGRDACYRFGLQRKIKAENLGQDPEKKLGSWFKHFGIHGVGQYLEDPKHSKQIMEPEPYEHLRFYYS